MTGKVHTICGVSAAVAVAVCWSEISIAGIPVYPWVGAIASAPGSLLPDIDIERSKAGSKVKWLSKHLKHRGITHTFLLPIIIAVVFVLVQKIPILPSLLFGFEVGYVCHIIADMFNKKGVPIFWPLYQKKVHIACIKTDSKWQQVMFVILWEVLCLIIVFTRYGIWAMMQEWGWLPSLG